jgi:RHS repeat-associated protein
MQDGYVTAGFNALNQPVGIWSFAYQGTANWMFFGYDPLGRCVKRWVGPHMNNQVPPATTNPATYYYYDGWNLVQEGLNGAPADYVYVHGGRVDEIVASAASGIWRQHHYDARGHCILLTTSAGAIMEQYDYDAFGRPYFYGPGGSSMSYSWYGNRFLFTGREWIRELRLYDYRNRMYQPELGRFLQPDPVGLHMLGAAPLSSRPAFGEVPKKFTDSEFNLYRYCHNDPVNRTDPFGLESTDRDVELVDAIPGKFGNTEFKLSAAVAPVQTNGTFSLQVTRNDVTVTSKQVATTANGKERTAEAVKASKEHEGLHTSDIKAVHDANQNKVLQTGYPTQKDAQKEANKLNRDFGKAEGQSNQHKPDEKWKDIMLRERLGK